MVDKLSSKGKTGQKTSTTLIKETTAKFLMKDMCDFVKTLQYPVSYSMPGGQFFKEEVSFGEVWLTSVKSGTKYNGRVVRGLLYLKDEEGQFKVPAKLPIGKYKIWLDAWINIAQHADYYKDFKPFTASDWKKWAPPLKLPHKKHWQSIKIDPPKSGEEFSFVWIKSNRFHWIYRIDVLIAALGSMLKEYENLSRNAITLQQMARTTHSFLHILGKSGDNTGAWLISGNYPKYINMMKVLYKIASDAELWIQGGDTTNSTLLDEMKHMNNLAALLWHFLEQKDFKSALKTWDRFLSEENRMLISLIGATLARIPRAYDMPKAAVGGTTIHAKNVSPIWGQKFADEMYKPYFEKKRKEWGLAGPPAFKPSPSKSKALPEILDASRKYVVGSLNGISVFLIKEADTAGALLSKHWEELTVLFEKDASFEPHCLARLYRDELGMLPDSPEGKALGDVEKRIKEVQAEVEKRLKDITKLKDRPEKLTSYVAKTNPCAIYFLEAFEVGIKGWITVLAFQKLVVEGRKNLPRNIVDATGKTSSFVGAGLKSIALTKILAAKKVPLDSIKLLGKLGGGLAVAGESIGAGVFIYDNWLKDDSLGKEVAQYTDGDAYAIESFHVGIAYGKVITAVGSGLTLTIALAPAGVALVALGYAFQFVGEFLTGIWRIGASEKKWWKDMVDEINRMNLKFREGAYAKKYGVDFLPENHYKYLKSMVSDFKWMNIDPVLWGNYVKSFSAV
jgi:hypothetical protein